MCAFIVAAVSLLAACDAPDAPTSSQSGPVQPPVQSASNSTWWIQAPSQVPVAEAIQSSVAVYATPDITKPEMVLPNPWLLNGVPHQPIPQVFLVKQTRSDGWIQILLPQRPNGSTGWIGPGTARVLADQYFIVVTLHRHRVTVFQSGTAVYTGPAATGAPATPTPTGLFYLRVLLHTIDQHSVYGPYAYGLSAHSDALSTFDGSDAEIGIHGNNDPSVLGQSVTHGCVRVDNAVISRLAQELPLGTPVQIFS